MTTPTKASTRRTYHSDLPAVPEGTHKQSGQARRQRRQFLVKNNVQKHTSRRKQMASRFTTHAASTAGSLREGTGPPSHRIAQTRAFDLRGKAVPSAHPLNTCTHIQSTRASITDMPKLLPKTFE